MPTNLYQVLYVGPPRYEGTPAERAALEKTARSFIRIHGGRHTGLVAVKVGFLLGMFIIYTDTLQAAQGLPGKFDGFERQHDELEQTADKVRAAGPFFYEAEVF